MKRIAAVSTSFFLLLLSSSTLSAQPSRQGFAVFTSQGTRIDAGRYISIPFRINSYLRNARLAGSIQAQGGSGNDIIVRVFKNGQKLYDSRQQRSVVISVNVSEPGDYALVISNEFSIISSKVVWVYMNVVYEGVDVQRDSIEKQNVVRRQQLAEDILNRLFNALKKNERAWGTFQVQYKPRVLIAADENINARATAQANVIWINKGTFEVAEEFDSTLSSSVLAGVLGHEMAHIFYRHRTEHPTGWSIWDELMGALTLNRLQEQQADALGVRLACEAGFDARGLSMFLQKVADRYGNQGSFGQDHPQISQRIQTSVTLARRCKRS